MAQCSCIVVAVSGTINHEKRFPRRYSSAPMRFINAANNNISETDVLQAIRIFPNESADLRKAQMVCGLSILRT